jgi:hypothetical protein
LDKKLNAEWDMERIVGMAETAWEKAAARNKTEMEMAMTTVQTEKRIINMQKTAEGTWKTVVVNKKMEEESLYQNHHNTHQTDGRTILYTVKKKKLNQEQEQRLV